MERSFSYRIRGVLAKTVQFDQARTRVIGCNIRAKNSARLACHVQIQITAMRSYAKTHTKDPMSASDLS